MTPKEALDEPPPYPDLRIPLDALDPVLARRAVDRACDLLVAGPSNGDPAGKEARRHLYNAPIDPVLVLILGMMLFLLFVMLVSGAAYDGTSYEAACLLPMSLTGALLVWRASWCERGACRLCLRANLAQRPAALLPLLLCAAETDAERAYVAALTSLADDSPTPDRGHLRRLNSTLAECRGADAYDAEALLAATAAAAAVAERFAGEVRRQSEAARAAAEEMALVGVGPC